MNRIIFLIFIIFLFSLFIYSCERNLGAVDVNDLNGSILADVRYLWGNSKIEDAGSTKDFPRNPVSVDLRIRPENRYELITIQTKMTNAEGYALFDSLGQNTYYICPQLNEEIGKVLPGESVINFENQKDTVKTWIGYKWGFDRYEFEINSASSILAHINEDTLKYGFYNIAIDTLICEYDLSQIPQWLDLSINESICPPYGERYDTSAFEWGEIKFDYYNFIPTIIQLCYTYDDIPKDEIQSSFQMPVTHQFKTEYFTFTVNFLE